MEAVGLNRGDEGEPLDAQGPDVYLAVYDLDSSLSGFNSVLGQLGTGAYHVGVVVSGCEYAYDLHTGVLSTEDIGTGTNPAHAFREWVPAGRTPLTPDEVDRVVFEMEQGWRAEDYDILRQNCGHFAQEFVAKLRTPRGVPSYLVALTSSIVQVANQLPDRISDAMADTAQRASVVLTGQGLPA